MLDRPRSCQYVGRVDGANRKKSLHDVLRARRAAKPLLSVRELQLREAARRRDEEAELVHERVERWRLRQKSVDAEGKLAPAVYRAIFARSRRAYYGSRHWARRSRAQLELTSFCEVERCSRADDAPRPPPSLRHARRRACRTRLDHALQWMSQPRAQAGREARPPRHARGAARTRSAAAALRCVCDRSPQGEASATAAPVRPRLNAVRRRNPVGGSATPAESRCFSSEAQCLRHTTKETVA